MLQRKIEVCRSGAGVLAPLFVGAEMALEDAGLDSTVDAGTSAGAIISACKSLGKTGSDMEQIVLDADFGKLIPMKIWTYPLRGYAASNANAIAWLSEITEDQSLADCQSQLITVAGDEELQRVKVFSSAFAGAGSLPVWQVVLPSFSIPEVFPAWQGRYCDGGTMMNLPVQYLPGAHPRIALRVTERSQTGPVKGWLDRQERLLDMMLLANERDSVTLARKENIPVVDLPGGHTGFLDRNMTRGQKQKLIETGYVAMTTFLESSAGKRWLA